MTLADYCEVNDRQELLAEWDTDRNTELSPQSVDYATHRRAWWRCKEGHSWECQIKDRVLRSTGCPYCAGKEAIPGSTDLATTHPDLAKEWHPLRNKSLAPTAVTAGSARKIWWRCTLGHEWQASVENRAQKGTGCPYCAGRKALPGFNDLKTLFPQIAAQWHPTYNGSLRADQVRPGSGKKVWWLCGEGHEWEARIFSRTSAKGAGCPFCAGKIKIRRRIA